MEVKHREPYKEDRGIQFEPIEDPNNPPLEAVNGLRDWQLFITSDSTLAQKKSKTKEAEAMAKRRGKGEGCISKRKNGTWLARLCHCWL